MNETSFNNYLNPTPESVAALRGKFYGGAGLEKRYFRFWPVGEL